MEPLEGKYVRLREMAEADAPLVVAWRNRPEVARWLVQWEALTVEAHLQWFRSAIAKGDLILVFSTSLGKEIGAGSLYDFDRQRTSAEWGRLCVQPPAGIAVVEASYLVHRLAFEVLRMKRLHCACAAQNSRAKRLDTFLGYAQEGLRRKHLLGPEGYRDVIEFGLFAEEFEQRRPDLEKALYGCGPPPSLDAAKAGEVRRALGGVLC